MLTVCYQIVRICEDDNWTALIVTASARYSTLGEISSLPNRDDACIRLLSLFQMVDTLYNFPARVLCTDVRERRWQYFKSTEDRMKHEKDTP